MATRNALKGVLAGFLGTYTSRYSDYGGYWLFGFLLSGADVLNFDLLGEADSTESPEGFAHHLAKVKFADQLHKSSLPQSTVREATLWIERRPLVVERMAGDYVRRGFNLRFRATAVADTGRHFEQEQLVFVAPHDAQLESRSVRARA